jgi:hypothetical protein
MENENMTPENKQHIYAEHDKHVQEMAKQFPPMSLSDLTNVLDLTIKKDNANKTITFLAFLSAYTENSQLNLSLGAPSSSGKSYIPLEIASLFPKEDLIELAYCSAQAFFHEQGRYEAKTNTYFIDFERKILLFMDQPHSEVLKRIRPLLSHDRKQITSKITDKSEKGGLRTKNVVMTGHMATIFCSASLRMDEQEKTRFLLLSPETTQEKLKLGVSAIIEKEADQQAYDAQIDNHLDRRQLIERIKAIKAAHIREIRINDSEKIAEWFLQKNPVLQPRHQRDIKRLISIIKIHALLNLWHRPFLDIGVILTTEEDVVTGCTLWEQISLAQDMNLPPYVYDFYKDIILPLYQSKKSGVSIKEITIEHHKIYGRPLEDWKLRKEIIPLLQTAGLLTQERDLTDKRTMLVVPVTP